VQRGRRGEGLEPPQRQALQVHAANLSADARAPTRMRGVGRCVSPGAVRPAPAPPRRPGRG
jgi:hypothetical protein